MEKEEIIKIWKEKNIERVTFNFSCGGDEMDTLDIEIFDNEGNAIKDSTIEDYFDNKVYENVDFYEASDGHYMGESGTVDITLYEDEDEAYFIYDKESEGEWREENINTITFKLTKKEAKFVSENVTNMNGDGWYKNTKYKDKFSPSPEEEKIVKKLHDKITEFAQNYVPDEYEGDLSGSFEYTTNDEDEDEKLIITGQDLTLKMKTYCYVYRPQD